MNSLQVIDECLSLVSEIGDARTPMERIRIAGSLAGYLAALKDRLVPPVPAGDPLPCGHADRYQCSLVGCNGEGL